MLTTDIETNRNIFSFPRTVRTVSQERQIRFKKTGVMSAIRDDESDEELIGYILALHAVFSFRIESIKGKSY